MRVDLDQLHSVRARLVNRRLSEAYGSSDGSCLGPFMNSSKDFRLSSDGTLARNPGTQSTQRTAKSWADRLAYSIAGSELNAKTIQLHHLTRAGLIYLALGMRQEENKRDQAVPKGLKMPIIVDR